MKKIILMGAFLIVAGSTQAGAAGATVTNAKAVELSAHRIDRLVALGKIDISFLNNLSRIDIVAVPDQPPIYYKVTVSQAQPVQGMPIQLDILFDKDGKPLSFQLVPGGVTGPDAVWTVIDAVSLTENCMHYILENNVDPKVVLFDKGLTNVILSKETLNSETVARGQVRSSLTEEKLNIYLKLDGTFIFAEVVP